MGIIFVSWADPESWGNERNFCISHGADVRREWLTKGTNLDPSGSTQGKFINKGGSAHGVAQELGLLPPQELTVSNPWPPRPPQTEKSVRQELPQRFRARAVAKLSHRPDFPLARIQSHNSNSTIREGKKLVSQRAQEENEMNWLNTQHCCCHSCTQGMLCGLSLEKWVLSSSPSSLPLLKVLAQSTFLISGYWMEG